MLAAQIYKQHDRKVQHLEKRKKKKRKRTGQDVERRAAQVSCGRVAEDATVQRHSHTHTDTHTVSLTLLNVHLKTLGGVFDPITYQSLIDHNKHRRACTSLLLRGEVTLRYCAEVFPTSEYFISEFFFYF